MTRFALTLLACTACFGHAGAQELTFARVEVASIKPLLEGGLVVDVRDANAFNGWPDADGARGGHIPQSVPISIAWVAANLKGTKELLQNVGVLGTKPLLLVGANVDQADRMARLLVGNHGVDPARLQVLEGGFAAWSRDPDRPVEALPRYDRLVPPTWLAKAIANQPKLRVFEVSWGQGPDFARYAESHIPGAIHFDTDRFESGPIWNVVPAEQLTKALIASGIRCDTPVVLYGRNTMAAVRAMTVLLYAGVEDVRLLNGGLRAWTDAGLAVETNRNLPVPVADFGARVPVRPELITGITVARQLLSQPGKLLVDVRSWQEHTGEVAGYDDITATGRIPGTVWGHGGTDSMKMEDYRNPDGTLRDWREIARFWADAGITPQQTVGFHCGTGWRASEAFVAAWLMGWENITVYDGGWYEWSADPANPTATGIPKTNPQPDRHHR